MSGVSHVVLFRFRQEASDADRTEVANRMLGLADGERCGQRYIRSVRGGVNTSPEGLGAGFDLGFVVEFDSADDRDFYLGPPHVDGPGDPAHAAFTAFVTPLVAQTLVFDLAV